ncbi:MAG: PilZ domain-containing protein [Rhizobiales bacterium]|nr:PilZ domain-containing protein [Hyphomicrobiales bacterium]
MSALAIETNVDHITNKSGSNIIFGRFMLPDMTEHACQVLDVTAHGAVFITATVPAPNSSIVAYLEELGRVEVIAGEQVAGGFKVRYAATGSRLERLQQRIEWLKQKNDGAVEARRHPRFEPKDKHSSITLPDGRVYNCEVIDISISGAAIKTDVLPSIGTYVMLGKMKGRVVRYLDTGVAIEFIKQLDRNDIASSVA